MIAGTARRMPPLARVSWAKKHNEQLSEAQQQCRATRARHIGAIVPQATVEEVLELPNPLLLLDDFT